MVVGFTAELTGKKHLFMRGQAGFHLTSIGTLVRSVGRLRERP
jgi:hypothetical protein